MLPRWHIFFGFVFSYILVYFFNFSLFAGFIVFLASIFIDLDHVLLYFLETKDLHPAKFFEWGNKKEALWHSLSTQEKKNYQAPHFILHGIEFVIILLIFSLFHPFFMWVLLGILVHLALDFIDLYQKRKTHHFSLKASQIWLWRRNRGKKNFVLST